MNAFNTGIQVDWPLRDGHWFDDLPRRNQRTVARVLGPAVPGAGKGGDFPMWKSRLMNEHTKIRRRFFKSLLTALHFTWPIFSVLLAVIIGLGLLIGYIEGWRPLEGVYFGFVTALTVGYGDFVPQHTVSRVMAVGIGLTGVLLTALFAAVSVHALGEAVKECSFPPS